jgi:DNA-binding transcriptional LysR family regulator
MDDVEVRELRYFIAVAEDLNFTRAAERLGMAQPPLSVAIGKLERKLGVRLLERTSRRVALTEAGQTLLDQGRIAVEGLAAAVERARRRGAEPDRLTVAVKAGGGTALLRKITRRCARDPRLPEVRLLFGHADGPGGAVRSGAADVAILRRPFDRRGLDAEVLLAEPRVAVLPADHRLARRRRLRRADLAGEPMPRWAGLADPATVAYWTGTDTPPTPSPAPAPFPARPAAVSPAAVSPAAVSPGAVSPAAVSPPDAPLIGDMNQLLDVVALGQAVAYVPVSIARQYGGTDLVFIPVGDLSPSEVVVAWPDTSRSRAVAGFVQVAVEAAADRPEQAAAFA